MAVTPGLVGATMPGDATELDESAWTRLIAVGENPERYMLMYHRPTNRAAFKHVDTRKYLFV